MYDFMQYQRLRRQAFPKRYRHNRAMTQAEIDALDSIGFDWRLAASRPKGKKSTLKGQLEDGKVGKSKQPKTPAIQRIDLSSATEDDEL